MIQCYNDKCDNGNIMKSNLYKGNLSAVVVVKINIMKYNGIHSLCKQTLQETLLIRKTKTNFFSYYAAYISPKGRCLPCAIVSIYIRTNGLI